MRANDSDCPYKTMQCDGDFIIKTPLTPTINKEKNATKTISSALLCCAVLSFLLLFLIVERSSGLSCLE